METEKFDLDRLSGVASEMAKIVVLSIDPESQPTTEIRPVISTYIVIAASLGNDFDQVQVKVRFERTDAGWHIASAALNWLDIELYDHQLSTRNLQKACLLVGRWPNVPIR